MEPRSRTAPPRRTPRARWAAVTAAGALTVLAGVLVGIPDDPGPARPAAPVTPAAAATASATSSVTVPSTASTTAPAAPPAGAPAASPSAAGPALPPAAPPVRLAVEAAGIDVAVLPLAPTAEELAAQSLVPPNTLDGYWLTPYGVPGAGSQNTTYVAGHSWEDRDAPFNRLSDASLVGQEIELTTGTGTLEYVVDSVVTHDKDTLKDSDIWHVVPHRLVLISCYTEDPWGKNVVVTASPAGG
jgi:hypothetical protein